jgi:hypothetical protein
MRRMVLKPQDVFVALKLVALGRQPWTYLQLAGALFMSASEINAGVKRGLRARLLGPPPNGKGNPRPNLIALSEFLVHGLKYAFPPDRGALTLGVPTAHAAAPLSGQTSPDTDPPPVWPHPGGTVKGYAYSPLYRSVPEAALADPGFYELLALVDAIRDPSSRVTNLAVRELNARLRLPPEPTEGP